MFGILNFLLISFNQQRCKVFSFTRFSAKKSSGEFYNKVTDEQMQQWKSTYDQKKLSISILNYFTLIGLNGEWSRSTGLVSMFNPLLK